jgi:hypothetical protein
MIAVRSLICVAVAIATMRSAEALLGEGRPVTAKDISGKRICWNDGSWTQYAADGQFTNHRGAHRTWSVPDPGVIHVGAGYREVEVLPDGRFHMYWFNLLATERDQDRWGTVCN